MYDVIALPSRAAAWLLAGSPSASYGAPHRRPDRDEKTHPWWKVMCLSGVDYFSTLGYQPGIAILAAGLISPLATLVLVAVTLFGALPVYRWVAVASPHGAGSIRMLETLLPRWSGKVLVLCLLGFAITDFVITMTLSSADAAVHIVENPHVPAEAQHWQFWVTVGLLLLLGAVFMAGFSEAISVAVVLVPVYLSLNAVVLAVGWWQIARSQEIGFAQWWHAALSQHSSPWAAVAVAALVFPKLALGLSGFETGVSVMPLVRTSRGLRGRVEGTRRLLTTAALIMAGFLLTSSLVCTILIPAGDFEPGGAANGRALAYLAHSLLGETFGSVYDLSTVLILWFAGASAMAGLLNLIPRYLPRYGMAPEWTRAPRPLVLTILAAALVVTAVFRADVDAQGGAYATGVLVLMLSASFASTLSAGKRGHRRAAVGFAAITVVIAYTTADNMISRPDGLHVALVFIAALLAASFASRVWRASELRIRSIDFDETSQDWLRSCRGRTVRLIAHRPRTQLGAAGAQAQQLLLSDPDLAEKLRDEREWHRLPSADGVLFVEVTLRDPSDFEDRLRVSAHEIDGHRVLRAEGSSVPTCLAGVALAVRDRTGRPSHLYLEWSDGSPLVNSLRFLLLGRGQTATAVHEVLRRAVPRKQDRPFVHVT